MVAGILLAGGVGHRMNGSIPKQFLEVNGKPIICYPLDIMEKHSQIDVIEIVCVERFMDDVRDIVKQHGFNKVKWIIPGGATCLESTWNGLKNLKGRISDDDLILCHMTSYPLTSSDIIGDCIESAMENGNGFTARPIVHSVWVTDDRKSSTKYLDRDKLVLCTSPYAVRFGECFELSDRFFTENKGITEKVYMNMLYCNYGKKLYFTKDSEANVRITTPEDIRLMEALLKVVEENGEAQFH